jgi:hypothetical protein
MANMTHNPSNRTERGTSDLIASQGIPANMADNQSGVQIGHLMDPDRVDRSDTLGWEKRFLACLATLGNVTEACKRAKVTVPNVLFHRRRSKRFANEYADAMDAAADLLELEARRRGVEGVQEPVFHNGKRAGEWVDAEGKPCPEGTEDATFIPYSVTKYSDTLLIFLLKGARPEKFRENFKLEHSGIPKGAVTVNVLVLGGEARMEDI